MAGGIKFSAFIAEGDPAGRKRKRAKRAQECFFSTSAMYGRGKFLIFTPDAPIVASPAAALVVYELPSQKLPSDFLCHELSRARRACNINKFSAEIRPRCAISVRSAGDRRKRGKNKGIRGRGDVKQAEPFGKVERRYRARGIPRRVETFNAS